MALPLLHTFSGSDLAAAAAAGRYARLRFMQFGAMGGALKDEAPLWTRRDGPQRWPNTSATWFNATWAAAAPAYVKKGKVQPNPLMRFSAACAEFGRELVDALGADAPPVGLVQSAVGGTKIEAWSPNETIAGCGNTSGPNGALYYGMVAPFVNMTVRGWVWYQGENNMHEAPGSSLRGEGYACALPRMVRAWRAA
eukprot:gene12302-305_t